MKIRFIFVIFCISTLFILFLTILKIDLRNNTKYLYNANDTNENISSIIKFVIKPKCDINFIVWIVTSSANDAAYRTALRYAYPSEMLKSLNVTRIFLLGRPKEENMWKYILKESQKYNDLLQGDFLENYKNLTLKHLMGLKWVSSNCKANFLIKTDNDIVLDIFEILKLLQEKKIEENTMSGYILRNMKPIRISNNKWFATREDFPGEIYPDFLSGWFYITNLKVAQLLVNTSEKFKNFFWIDDVFVSGILRQKCDIKLKELNNFYATDYR